MERNTNACIEEHTNTHTHLLTLTHTNTQTNTQTNTHAHTRTHTFLPTQTKPVRMKTYPYRIGGSLFQRKLFFRDQS